MSKLAKAFTGHEMNTPYEAKISFKYKSKNQVIRQKIGPRLKLTEKLKSKSVSHFKRQHLSQIFHKNPKIMYYK